MIFAEMDAPGLLLVISGTITALVVAAGQIATIILQFSAAAQVEKVAEDLKFTTTVTAEKLDDIAQTSNANHSLLNSSMAAQLLVGAKALRRIADMTKHPVDAEAADLAEKNYVGHMRKQAHLDATDPGSETGKGKGPGKPAGGRL